MQPRLHLFRARRPTMSIVRISHQGQPSLCLRLAPQRSITSDEKPLPKADEGAPGPNQEQLPHVSEEAASMSKITGGGGPEIEEQGTPVDEVLKRDQGSREKAPKVMKEPMQPASPTGTRSFSTSTHPRQDAMTGFDDSRLQTSGHKFELPALPLAANMHLKYRYAPVVKQVTNLLMRDGKLSVAQRNMAMILNHLRTASPPSVNPERPLLPGSPPASHLPLNPILYLTLAIDSVAPLLRIRAQKGMAGGGVALQMPVPLALRQRRRQAVMWILDSASKKPSRGSGRGGFAQKVAEEVIAIVEGRSGVWDRRGGIHKLAVSARANLNVRRR
ncbi:MAG: hypothetical protein L6R38_005768 [Xanthoria sp. 2 TBL-2021]|nr:MAG: hypothetical protein L6R38_005768 [Xanthoria sp. 2 TBL-2021]